MRIEFLGVSGVGKTTIARKYKANLEKEGKSVLWPTEDLYTKHGWFSRNAWKALAVIAFTAGHWKWVCGYAHFVYAEIGSVREAGKPIFNGIFLKLMLERAKEDGQVYLFDEGVLQLYWALKLRSGKQVSSAQLEEMASRFALSDQVVNVEADAETIAKRIKTRGEYVRILEVGDLLDAISKMQCVQKEIIRLVQGKTSVERVVNN